MAIGKGYRNLAGFKKETTYGTPVAVGATNLIEYVSENFEAKSGLVEDDQIAGSATLLTAEKSVEMHGGDITMHARYQGLETLIACGMGATGGAPTQLNSEDAYEHDLTIADDLEGLFGTFVFWLQGLNVKEFVSCKVNSLDFSVKPAERLRFTAAVIPNKLNINTSSGTNTTTTAATITQPAQRDFVTFPQLVARINDRSGAALGASDKVYVSEFGIKLDNKMPSDDYTSQFGTYIDEPIRDGFVPVTGYLVFTKYGTNNMQLFADQLAKTRKKLDVVFTGPTCSASYNYTWSFFFPDIQFTSGTPVTSGPGRMSWRAEFISHRLAVAPTGFPAWAITPLNLKIVNKFPTNPLA